MRSVRFCQSTALLLSLLLALVLLPYSSSASPSLRRHSPDFQQKMLSYGDVWTREELEALAGVLKSLEQHGLAYTLRVFSVDRIALSRLLEKLSSLDERLSLAIGVLLNLSKRVPESLLDKVSSAAPLGQNASLLVKAVNNLYAAGELSSLDYLTLIGYIANEFKIEYVEDPETLANIRRVAAEVASIFDKSSLPLLPDPDRPGGSARSSLLVKAPEVSGSVLALTAFALLAPVVGHAAVILLARSRYPGLVPIRRALLAPGTVASVLTSPEDSVSAYWAAVGMLSRVVPREPWDTHREYLARVERGLGEGDALTAFRVLSEEYERVRFAGERGSLSRELLAELVLRVARGIRRRQPYLILSL